MVLSQVYKTEEALNDRTLKSEELKAIKEMTTAISVCDRDIEDINEQLEDYGDGDDLLNDERDDMVYLCRRLQRAK